MDIGRDQEQGCAEIQMERHKVIGEVRLRGAKGKSHADVEELANDRGYWRGLVRSMGRETENSEGVLTN